MYEKIGRNASSFLVTVTGKYAVKSIVEKDRMDDDLHN